MDNFCDNTLGNLDEFGIWMHTANLESVCGSYVNPSSFWKASSSSPSRCQLLALASAKRVTQLQSWCFDLSLATWRHECRSYICALHIQGGSAHCTGHKYRKTHENTITKTQTCKYKHKDTNAKRLPHKNTKSQRRTQNKNTHIHTNTKT